MIENPFSCFNKKNFEKKKIYDQRWKCWHLILLSSITDCGYDKHEHVALLFLFLFLPLRFRRWQHFQSKWMEQIGEKMSRFVLGSHSNHKQPHEQTEKRARERKTHSKIIQNNFITFDSLEKLGSTAALLYTASISVIKNKKIVLTKLRPKYFIWSSYNIHNTNDFHSIFTIFHRKIPVDKAHRIAK